MRFQLILLASAAVSTAGCVQFCAIKSISYYHFRFDNTHFEQDGVALDASPTYHGVDFRLENKSQAPMKIVWDDSSFIDVNGQVHKVMHNGVRYIARDQSLPPTNVPPGASVSDTLTAVDLVHFNSSDFAGGWKVEDHLPRGQASATASVGKQVSIFLVLVDDAGKKINISLPMKITSAELGAQQNQL